VIMVHGVAVIVTAIGTILFYTVARSHTDILAVLIGSTAGFFIYIAASDIIPSINETRSSRRAIDVQVLLVLLGALVLSAGILIAHHFID
jgi:zinc and cadmium transporter